MKDSHSTDIFTQVTEARDLDSENQTKVLTMSIQSTTQKTPIVDKGLDAQTIKKL